MQKAGELTVHQLPEAGTSTYSYIWKFGGKDLDQLRNVLEFSGQSKLETNIITFESGVLKDCDHTLQFFISFVDEPQFFAKIMMSPPIPQKQYFNGSKIEVADIRARLESSWRVFSKTNAASALHMFTPEESMALLSNSAHTTWWKSRKITFGTGIMQAQFRVNLRYAYWSSAGVETVPCPIPQKEKERSATASPANQIAKATYEFSAMKDRLLELKETVEQTAAAPPQMKASTNKRASIRSKTVQEEEQTPIQLANP